MPPRILLVDDDEQLAETLGLMLRQEGYDVALALTANQALTAARHASPDLVLLDVSLPDLTGVETCRRLRAFWRGPVIMLTARRNEADKILGLDAGADDYVTKPFSPQELLARIRAGLRRRASKDSGGASGRRLAVGELVIDLDSRSVVAGGEPVELTAREFELLAVLAQSADRVLTRQELFDLVWGPQFVGDDHALDVYISNLRRKIEPTPDSRRYIRTRRGVGYMLSTTLS